MRYVTLGTKSEFKMFRLRLPDGNVPPDDSVRLSPEFGTAVVLKVFDRANITEADQAALLGIPAETLRQFHTTDAAPKDRQVLDRLTDFLRCYVILKVIYVRDYELICAWLTNPNTAVPPTPIEHMKRFGIHTVRAYLESALCR